MAKSTRQHVFEGMELLPEGLISFVEKRMESQITGHWQVQVVERVRGLRPTSDGQVNWDQQGLLQVMMAFWKEAFSMVLGHTERSYISELLEVRNKLSHNENFTYDDAERALDSMRRSWKRLAPRMWLRRLAQHEIPSYARNTRSWLETRSGEKRNVPTYLSIQ